MANISLTIDNRAVIVPSGTSIWNAAKSIGVYIPVLCHHEKLRPVGVCRMCVVDTGGRVLAASCIRPCEEGMKVETASPKVEKHRKMLTALLLADHPVPCAKERTTGDDLLDALGRRYGLLPSFSPLPASGRGAGGERFERPEDLSSREQGMSFSPLPASGRGAGGERFERPEDLSSREQGMSFSPLPASGRGAGGERFERPTDRSSPVIAVDHRACILCDRCIRACDEIQCNDVIGRTGKGYTTRIGFDLDDPMGHSTCVSCGECVAACPTGALTNKTLTLPLVPPSTTTNVESVCPYCGVGSR